MRIEHRNGRDVIVDSNGSKVTNVKTLKYPTVNSHGPQGTSHDLDTSKFPVATGSDGIDYPITSMNTEWSFDEVLSVELVKTDDYPNAALITSESGRLYCRINGKRKTLAVDDEAFDAFGVRLEDMKLERFIEIMVRVAELYGDKFMLEDVVVKVDHVMLKAAM